MFELYEPFQALYNEVQINRNALDSNPLDETCKSECILVPTDDRCSENIELSGPSGAVVSAETVLAFQVLAEGLQVALAQESGVDGKQSVALLHDADVAARETE